MPDPEIQRLAVEVAELLGGFTAELDPDKPIYLTRGNDACLMFRRVLGKPDRLWIVGGYPDADSGDGLPRHEITVGVHRGATAIAGEIIKRLLPAYEEDMTTARERQTSRRAAHARRVELVARLLDAVPTAHVAETSRGLLISWSKDAVSCSISVYGDATKSRIEIDGAGENLVAEIARMTRQTR